MMPNPTRMQPIRRRAMVDDWPAPFLLRLIVGTALLLAVSTSAWAQSPRPGAHPLDTRGQLHTSPDDRCPVCAMRPIKYPRFAAAIQLANGTTFYFCSAGCMLKAWLQPLIFLNCRAEALQRPVAQDYFSGEPVDARQVFWIAGSDVIGPMGPALVPLREFAHVEAFRRRHGAGRIFRLETLNLDNWETLTGKPFRF